MPHEGLTIHCVIVPTYGELRKLTGDENINFTELSCAPELTS